MATKREDREKRDIMAQLTRVFEYCATSTKERQEVVDHWLAGDDYFHVILAVKRRLHPTALLVGALIDTECPAWVPNGVLPTKTLMEFFGLIERMEVQRGSIPVENMFEPVDNLTFPVDNSVEKPVDNYASYPQAIVNLPLSATYPQGGCG